MGKDKRLKPLSVVYVAHGAPSIWISVGEPFAEFGEFFACPDFFKILLVQVAKGIAAGNLATGINISFWINLSPFVRLVTTPFFIDLVFLDTRFLGIRFKIILRR